LTDRIRRAPWHSPWRALPCLPDSGSCTLHPSTCRRPSRSMTRARRLPLELPSSPAGFGWCPGSPPGLRPASLCIALSGDAGLSGSTDQHSGFGATTAWRRWTLTGWSAACMDGPVSGRRDVTPHFPRVTPRSPLVRDAMPPRRTPHRRSPRAGGSRGSKT
jgi:hypothetical protein